MSNKRLKIEKGIYMNINPPFPKKFFIKDESSINNNNTDIDNDEFNIIDNFDYEYEDINYNKEIEDIIDLINIGNNLKIKLGKRYNFDVYKLKRLLPILEEINNLVGINDLKKKIFELSIYYLQDDLELCYKNKLHTVFTGPPGVGKTMIANIYSRFLVQLGILESEKIIKATRADLIAGYLGQTYTKTKKKIMEAIGGILFIDEVYSLGNSEGKDSFSKECIDCINEHLTLYQGRFICIIAGYKDDVKNCFFKYNIGLESRFGIYIDFKEYDGDELMKIFILKIKKENWFIGEDINVEIFKKNKEIFKYNGRDIETLFEITKLVHAKRVLLLSKNNKKKIIMKDIEKAIEIYKLNDNVIDRTKNSIYNSYILSSIYM